ncbi:MAG: DNA translocase FtsK 4TM domain-containing protein, partial [Clostridiales bacterium]|nr:DNA translocase FtsK 4TM domain-containing protein [Clostridiales bacterium]
MATSSRKPSSRRGGKTKKERMEEMERQDAIRTEIILWVVVAVALLLFISNFGVGGVIGRAISGFLFGVFGLMEYVVPVLLIVGSFFVASNRGNSQAVVKIIAAVVFVLFFCMIISLIVNGSDTLKPIEAFKQCSKNRGGGGILGCMLAYAIVAGFGLIGAYIVGIVAIIIAVLLFTGRSLMRLMKRGGQRAYDSAVENSEQRREYREYRNKEWEQRREEKEEQERQRREEKEELEERRREEREKRRLERKISGVSADTEIKRPRAGASDDMEEIYEGDELASPESEKPEESVAAAQPEEAAKAEETVDEEPRILFGGETRSTAAKTAAAKTQTDAQEQNGPELPPLAEHKVVSLEPVITGNYADEPVTPSGQERAEEFTDSEIESLLASSVQDIVTG